MIYAKFTVADTETGERLEFGSFLKGMPDLSREDGKIILEYLPWEDRPSDMQKNPEKYIPEGL